MRIKKAVIRRERPTRQVPASKIKDRPGPRKTSMHSSQPHTVVLDFASARSARRRTRRLPQPPATPEHASGPHRHGGSRGTPSFVAVAAVRPHTPSLLVVD